MAEDEKFRNECQHLLLKLKNTVEVLLGNHSGNIWNTYGGLTRLTGIVTNIFCHLIKSNQIDDCWNCIMGLRVLVPTTAPWLEKHRLATEGNSGRSYLWFQQRLQEHTLSSYLKVLLNDDGHLKSCYNEKAFVRQPLYANALLTCLRAIEDNQIKLLAEIDPSLLVNQVSTSSLKKHGRSPSLPSNVHTITEAEGNYYGLHCSNDCDPNKEFYHRSKYLHKLRSYSDFPTISKSTTWHFNLCDSAAKSTDDNNLKVEKEFNSDGRRLKSKLNDLNRSEQFLTKSVVSINRRSSEPFLANVDKIVIKSAKSSPCIINDLEKKSNFGLKSEVCGTLAETPVSKCQTKVKTSALMRSPSHTRSRSDIGVLSKNVGKLNEDVSSPNVFNLPMSASLPNVLQSTELLPRPNTDDYPPTPMFRRPIQGQSLTSFLSSQDFRTCAELDKENAHFSISEALIAAFEQIKCNQLLKIAEEEDRESDDDEIKHLKQRIRIRRHQKLHEKLEYRNNLLSDGCTDTTTTSQTPSPRSSSSEKSSSESVDPLDLSDGSEIDSKLSALNETGLSLSMASLYSDADIRRPMPSTSIDRASTENAFSSGYSENRNAESENRCLSAESVALNLLKMFSEKQLPKASDLEWLVSEQDAAQQLLPLPSSWPISPDDAEEGHFRQMRLRGNLQWAPPRPQIIFNIHPSPQRKVIMAKQNYRCAGCGTKVEQGFMKRFRYCEYLGKYFCQCCHNNNSMYIPGRILKKWDFNKYHVSNFSMDLLLKISSDPLFDISQLNPSLYKRVKTLYQVFHFRLQLYFIKDFIQICRSCSGLNEELQQLPTHLSQSPHLYSLLDLIQVRNSEMLAKLKPLVTKTLAHIEQCQLCRARGYFCEFCKNHDDLIFPFQIDNVIRCPGCWACFHVSCFVPDKCPKCLRIEARKLREMQVEENE